MSEVTSVSLIICEKLLLETDVPSAIRIVDLFYIPVDGDGVVVDLQAAVPVNVLGILKIPGTDRDEHKLRFELHRPDGEVQQIGKLFQGIAQESFTPEIPIGFNSPLQVFVKPRQFGTHYIVWLMDDKEIARAPFTLLPIEATPSV